MLINSSISPSYYSVKSPDAANASNTPVPIDAKEKKFLQEVGELALLISFGFNSSDRDQFIATCQRLSQAAADLEKNGTPDDKDFLHNFDVFMPDDLKTFIAACNSGNTQDIQNLAAKISNTPGEWDLFVQRINDFYSMYIP